MLCSLIQLIHFCILLFVILTPFCSHYKYIFIHVLFIPLLILHWKLNDDTCVLTEIEKIITKENQNKKTFIGSIIGPVYEPKSNTIQVICFILWIISCMKLYKLYVQ